jgi:hypothetical protein
MINLPDSSTVAAGALSNFEESIGTKVIAAKVDVQHTIVTIHPNSLNNTPAIPVNMVKGTNTATITKVVAITEIHTSFVA